MNLVHSLIFAIFTIPLVACTTNTVDSLFINPECDSACFQGITPNVTTASELEILLEESNVDYSVDNIVGDTLEWYWPLEASHILADEVNNTTVMVITDGQDSGDVPLVSSITIIFPNLCMKTVLDGFGEPELIVESLHTGYTIVYEERGLAFLMGEDGYQVLNIQIRLGDYLINAYQPSEILTKVDNIQFIEYVNSGSCEDHFN